MLYDLVPETRSFRLPLPSKLSAPGRALTPRVGSPGHQGHGDGADHNDDGEGVEAEISRELPAAVEDGDVRVGGVVKDANVPRVAGIGGRVGRVRVCLRAHGIAVSHRVGVAGRSVSRLFVVDVGAALDMARRGLELVQVGFLDVGVIKAHATADQRDGGKNQGKNVAGFVAGEIPAHAGHRDHNGYADNRNEDVEDHVPVVILRPPHVNQKRSQFTESATLW